MLVLIGLLVTGIYLIASGTAVWCGIVVLVCLTIEVVDAVTGN